MPEPDVLQSASSRGMGRYWFSLIGSDSNKVKIIECKSLGDPATSYYQWQKPHRGGVQDVRRYFSDFQTIDSYVLHMSSSSFWFRPKHFQFLKR